jgi:hypothetical protein
MEHGVNLESYFKETWRILKPGGTGYLDRPLADFDGDPGADIFTAFPSMRLPRKRF